MVEIMKKLGQCVASKISYVNHGGIEQLANDLYLENRRPVHLTLCKNSCYYGDAFLFELTPTRSVKYNASVVLRDLLNIVFDENNFGIRFVRRDIEEFFIFSESFAVIV